jgi:hypothetical protein
MIYEFPSYRLNTFELAEEMWVDQRKGGEANTYANGHESEIGI